MLAPPVLAKRDLITEWRRTAATKTTNIPGWVDSLYLYLV